MFEVRRGRERAAARGASPQSHHLSNHVVGQPPILGAQVKHNAMTDKQGEVE
ncbi:predicted protein [Sclerotinia sclerotiorum 1980 UF-70]|uniref:Uncharacterized protein n=2 Tax=Sclerotinia sclerotiorum (strain ATCC 18683 / 1980 / Ss-1) TaxID=665079 RepID=A7F8A5_SCLS1|nr:predicted protein [Sclerotinia sclerotiorum 1980 UF-70]APA13278.1 hypothetical protein sscle_10g080480 [Sclerotinia sclerotiorum 1980 UF-70]EDN98976.1 predicted protein [Sclerotinia sclerotiorum 1980 UF-70]